MTIYYKAIVSRIITDHIEVIVKSEYPRDMMELEREVEAASINHYDLDRDSCEIKASLVRIDLIEDTSVEIP